MNKKISRIRRATLTRKKIIQLGITRLIVHRTSRHIYAQIVVSDGSMTLAFASTLEKKIHQQIKYTGNIIAATVIGTLIAKRAIKKGINKVAFDRSGYKYHGRILALAEAARKVGLKF